MVGQSAYFAEKPKPVKVWKAMTMVMLSYKGDQPSEQALANYQRDKWGNLAGEVCVAELSGLAANKMEEGKQQLKNLFSEAGIRKLRQDRVEIFRERISNYSPKIVIMYTMSQKDDWERIAGGPFKEQKIGKLFFGIRHFKADKSTIIALTWAPSGGFGIPNSYWPEVANQIQKFQLGIN